MPLPEMCIRDSGVECEQPLTFVIDKELGFFETNMAKMLLVIFIAVSYTHLVAETYAEEMRVLYVALTRAKEKL